MIKMWTKNADETLAKLKQMLRKLKEYLYFIIVREGGRPRPTRKSRLRYFYRWASSVPENVIDNIRKALYYAHKDKHDIEVIIFGFDNEKKPYLIVMSTGFDDSLDRILKLKMYRIEEVRGNERNGD